MQSKPKFEVRTAADGTQTATLVKDGRAGAAAAQDEAGTEKKKDKK